MALALAIKVEAAVAEVVEEQRALALPVPTSIAEPETEHEETIEPPTSFSLSALAERDDVPKMGSHSASKITICSAVAKPSRGTTSAESSAK